MWSPYIKQNIQKIEMVQRNAARWVSKSYSYYDSVSAMLSNLGWRSLGYRRYAGFASRDVLQNTIRPCCSAYAIVFISGLKFISMNINSIRGKKLELLAFLDFHQPHVVAIQETKIDSSIATSELFPETCPYSVYRKDRNIHGGGVMLLVHKDISHMPITELENDSESIWVKVFANKTSHFVASWYRPPGSTSEEFQLFREQLDYIRTHHKGKKLPSVHVLGDFNFKDIDWPDRLSQSGSTLSQPEGQILIDIMNDHGLEQMVHFPTREKNTLDLILTTLPGQFKDVHSPDKLSDHDIVSGTLKIFIPPIKKYQK